MFGASGSQPIAAPVASRHILAQAFASGLANSDFGVGGPPFSAQVAEGDR